MLLRSVFLPCALGELFRALGVEQTYRRNTSHKRDLLLTCRASRTARVLILHFHFRMESSILRYQERVRPAGTSKWLRLQVRVVRGTRLRQVPWRCISFATSPPARLKNASERSRRLLFSPFYGDATPIRAIAICHSAGTRR